MKRFLIICGLGVMSLGGNSQGLSNIFSQKSADIKSMLKQIALLQVYIGWIEKGYNIVREGLTVIGEIKQGEFNLHNVFVSSLSDINPEIRKYSRIGTIISMGQAVEKELGRISQVKNLTVAELNYLLTVKGNMLKACSAFIDELIDILSIDEFRMTDDERIKRINGIYVEMSGQLVTAKMVTVQVQGLDAQRQREEGDIESLRNLE